MQAVDEGHQRRLAAFWLAAALFLAGPAAAQEQVTPPLTAGPEERLSANAGAVVLMYHRFGEDSLPSTSVSLAQFDAHLAELTSGRYRVVALPEIVAGLSEGRLPAHSVAITIDDAALSVYREAWPRLKALNLPFTLFVSSEAPDLGLPGYMSWDQLRELAADPLVTIGNHGHSHAHMTAQSPAEQRAELETAAARLSAELGARPEIFAYPYGEISLALRRSAMEAGFAAAFGQHSGAVGLHADRFALPRFPLNEAYGDLDRFRLVANALPLPVEEITPADSRVASAGENPPNLGFTVAAPIGDLGGLNCFASAGEPQLLRLGQRIELRFAEALPAGRVRINCTLRGEGGRWRWLGMQLVVSEAAAS